MEEKKSNGHLSESLRRKLENFPEQFPSENEWQEIRNKMLSEGLLRKKPARKRYLALLLLLLVAGLITVPLWIRNQHPAVKPGSNQSETEVKKQNGPVESKATDEHAVIQTPNPKPIYEGNKNQQGNPANPAKPEKHIKEVTENSAQPKTNAPSSAGSRTKQAAVFSDAGSAKPENKEKQNNENSIQNQVNPEKSAEKVTEEKSVTSSEAPVGVDSSNGEKISEAVPAADSVSSTRPEVAKADSASVSPVAEAIPENKNPSPGKLRLGFFVSWDRNSYYLKESSNASTEANYIMNSDSMSGQKSAAQFTVGLRGIYFISNKAALEAGVFYSQKRKLDAAIYTPQYSTSSGEYASDFIYHLNASYFELDQRIKYFIYHRKPSIYISAGVRESFNLHQGDPDYFEHTIYSTTAAPHTERVLLKPASVSLSLVAAAGIEIPLNARCDFFFEPAYTYAFDPVINNPESVSVPVNLYRRSFALGTGLYYRF